MVYICPRHSQCLQFSFFEIDFKDTHPGAGAWTTILKANGKWGNQALYSSGLSECTKIERKSKIALMEKKTTQTDEPLPKEAIAALQTFLGAVPVGRLSKTLRNLFLSHVYHEMDTPSLALEENILDLQALFDLLDALET